MPRYMAMARPLAPPRQFYDDDYYPTPVRTTVTVVETDQTPVPTGLLDASGTELYRLSESVPCGFTAKHDA